MARLPGTCVICGEAEHRDEHDQLIRCPEPQFERSGDIKYVALIDLGW
jgi:hypothetical protein